MTSLVVSTYLFSSKSVAMLVLERSQRDKPGNLKEKPQSFAVRLLPKVHSYPSLARDICKLNILPFGSSTSSTSCSLRKWVKSVPSLAYMFFYTFYTARISRVNTVQGFQSIAYYFQAHKFPKLHSGGSKIEKRMNFNQY